MAINKVVYGTTVLVDLSNDTVTAETLALGETAHDKAGNVITGTMEAGGGIPCTLTVTTSPNATVTATFEGTTLTATADSSGVATFVLEKEGVFFQKTY